MRTIPRALRQFQVDHNGKIAICELSSEAIADLCGPNATEIDDDTVIDAVNRNAKLLDAVGRSVWRDGDVQGDVALITASYLQSLRSAMIRNGEL